MADGLTRALERLRNTVNNWRNVVQTWYPNLDSQTYCVPPVYLNRLPYVWKDIAGQPVLVVQHPPKHASCRLPPPVRGSGTPGKKSISASHVPSEKELDSKKTSTTGLFQSDSRNIPRTNNNADYGKPGPTGVMAKEHPKDSDFALTTAVCPDSSSNIFKPVDNAYFGQPGSEKENESNFYSVFQTAESFSQISVESTQTRSEKNNLGTTSGISVKSGQPAFTVTPLWSDKRSLPDMSTTAHPASLSSSRGYLQSPRRNTGRSSQNHHREYSMWSRDHKPGLKPEPKFYDSDTREDFAQQHLMHCLHTLAEDRKEVMFVISQLSFGDYLHKPCYTAAAKHLPRPSDLPESYRRGDFDVIIIHRHYGLLIGEIKAIGLDDAFFQKVEADREADIANRVLRAIKQLNKSETVVKHLISDVAPSLSVRKTLILPYITRSQLLQVLDGDDQLEKALRDCLGASSGAGAVQMCLCSDQMSAFATPWDVTEDVLSHLSDWWERRLACSLDPMMSSTIYLDLIARFCGPATTMTIHCAVPPRMEIRTLWEAVSEVGERLASLVLTPEQLDILTLAPDTACLAGPPGTGKTIVLVLIALIWLTCGLDVHILSTRSGSYAVSRLIFYQLQKTLTFLADTMDLPNVVGAVHFHHFDLQKRPKDVHVAVNTLVSLSQNRRLQVLMDEALFGDEKLGSVYNTLIDDLASSVNRLCLWAATVSHANTPQGLQLVRMTLPLRSAPVVLREVEKGIVEAGGEISSYTSSGTLPPSDGPRVISLRHHGEDHAGRWPVDCYECGLEVAKVLKDLHVGDSGAYTKKRPRSTKNTPGLPPPLQYRDVFILTRSYELSDEVLDDAGGVTSSASDVVRGLRAAGLPVGVVSWKDDVDKRQRSMAEMAVAGKDEVTVCDYRLVNGLERKVVVHLPGRVKDWDDKLSDDDIQLRHWLYSMSRCSTQLVLVEA